MSDEGEDEGDRDYNSGPFCRHWGDPSDCDIPCKCGHACSEHCYSDKCRAEGCTCEDFERAPEG